MNNLGKVQTLPTWAFQNAYSEWEKFQKVLEMLPMECSSDLPSPWDSKCKSVFLLSFPKSNHIWLWNPMLLWGKALKHIYFRGILLLATLQEEFSGDSHLEEHLVKALRGWCTQNHATVSVSKPAWPLPWRVVLGGSEGGFLFPAVWFLPEVWLQRHRAHPWTSTVPSVLACPSAGHKLQTTDGFSLENLFSSRLTPPNPRDPSISWSN